MRLSGDNIGQDVKLKVPGLVAPALKLKLEEIETEPGVKDLEKRLSKLAKQKQVNAIMTTATRPFFAERKRIVELAGNIPVACYLLPEGVCR